VCAKTAVLACDHGRGADQGQDEYGAVASLQPTTHRPVDEGAQGQVEQARVFCLACYDDNL
jgi:hypothetical protein